MVEPDWWVDLDGVLADFKRHNMNLFGIPASRTLDNVDWEKVRSVKDFYLTMPPMEDLDLLWNFISKYTPKVLTGVPYSIPSAAEEKTAWVRKHLGPDVEVRCTRSKDKCLHATPGAILIDDWEKYKDLWVNAGGVWVTHISAEDTIRQLIELGYS